MSDTITERLAEIRSKPFGDLTASEQADWMTHDADTYFAAANVWARGVAEREFEREMRRRGAEDVQRVLRPFRRLGRLVSGRARRAAALSQDTEETQ